MTRAAIFAGLLLLLAGASAGAAQGDLGYTVPTDGTFQLPDDVTWNHNIIAWWWLPGLVAASGFGLWVVQWIDDDARRVGLPSASWTCAGLGIAGASLLSFFILPPWLAVPAILAAFVALALNYIPLRNAKVIAPRRLFTPEHREALKRRVMSALDLHGPGVEKRLAKLSKEHVPVALYDQSGRAVSAAEASFDPSDPITIVKVIVGEAARRHAREIQLVPGPGQLSVSYLIDGVMHAGPSPDAVQGSAATLVIRQTLVNAASETPQFRIQLPTLGRKSFNVRVCVYGEGDAQWMKLRLSNDGESMRKLPQLGLAPAEEALVRSTLDSARGLVAVASPAAMGAHTTIYAMLDSLDPFSRNIVTFERPILGHIDSVDQRAFTDARSPADSLDEVLRKEVDVVMLSEIPDARVADMALTGASREQLFIARLEVHDACAVPARLIALGATPESVAAGLHTAIGQRLVRRLCPACRQKAAVPAAVLQKLGINPAGVECVWEESSSGCDQCGQTGFLGRAGIFEIWQPSAASRKLIARNAPAAELHAAALRDGMTSLQHSGLALVLDGTTSLRELARAIKAN